MKKRTLVSTVYKERGPMNECSPGINVIQAFRCQLAELGSQSPVSEASDQSRIIMGDMEEEFTVEKVLFIAHEVQIHLYCSR